MDSKDAKIVNLLVYYLCTIQDELIKVLCFGVPKVFMQKLLLECLCNRKMTTHKIELLLSAQAKFSRINSNCIP